MKKIKEYKKNKLKSNISEILDLPKEIMLNIPVITMLGNEQINVENFKGIIEYTEEKIRLNSSLGILKIEGCNLCIKEMYTEKILILGKLNKIEFIL